MRKQLVWTTIAEALIMASGILLLRFSAQLLNPEGFGEYMLSRRASGLIYLPLVMGFGIAAPRYIAIVRGGTLPGYGEREFVLATLGMGLVPSVIAIGILNLDHQRTAALLFGSSSLGNLVAPTSAVVGGLALHSITYAVFRGRGNSAAANTIQLANIGIAPLAALALAPRDAASVLALMAAIMIAISLLGFAMALLRERTASAASGDLRSHARLLLRYGLPRVPGEFALIGLVAIPALLSVRAHGLVVAGQFSAALTLLTVITSAFAPVGLVTLPIVSAQAASGDLVGVRRLVVRMLVAGVALAIAGVVLGEAIMPVFVGWYFGAEFLPAVPVFRTCLLGAIPFVVYVLLRNILDALDVRAINTRNLLITLAVLVALCVARSGIMWMATSLVASLGLLCSLTVRDTYLMLRVPRGSPLPTTA